MENTYHGVLQMVIEAAREAGTLLRQDLLKPSGPSGHDGHAEADEPAERLIRQRLFATTPAWAGWHADRRQGCGSRPGYSCTSRVSSTKWEG